MNNHVRWARFLHSRGFVHRQTSLFAINLFHLSQPLRVGTMNPCPPYDPASEFRLLFLDQLDEGILCRVIVVLHLLAGRTFSLW